MPVRERMASAQPRGGDLADCRGWVGLSAGLLPGGSVEAWDRRAVALSREIVRILLVSEGRPTCRSMYAIRMVLAAWLVLIASVAHAGAPKPLPRQRFVVVIDAGHGGSNRGCRNADASVAEKAVTLAIARAVKRDVERGLPHARVLLTRVDDATVPLGERTAVANGENADLLISIHANASPGRDQHGFETYVLAPDVFRLEAARLARRSPEAVGDDANVAILLDTLGIEALYDRAVFMAGLVQEEQSERFPGRTDRGLKQATFDVLMSSRSPAILVEVGFLDHPAEGRLLQDEASRRVIAEGLGAAVLRYYRHAAQAGWLRSEPTQ